MMVFLLVFLEKPYPQKRRTHVVPKACLALRPGLCSFCKAVITQACLLSVPVGGVFSGVRVWVFIAWNRRTVQPVVCRLQLMAVEKAFFPHLRIQLVLPMHKPVDLRGCQHALLQQRIVGTLGQVGGCLPMWPLMKHLGR